MMKNKSLPRTPKPQALRFYLMSFFSLFTFHSSLFTFFSSLFTFHSSLFTFFSSLFTFHFSLNAQQSGWPLIRNYTPKEYSGAPQVFSVLQDKNTGIMYFGIEPGIFSYDGVRWTEIPVPVGNIAFGLCQTDDGRIYISGNSGFGYLATNPQGKTVFQSLTHLIQDSTIKFGVVWSVKSASKEVFFQTSQNIFRYLPEKNTLQTFAADTIGSFYGDFVHNGIYHIRFSNKATMKIEKGELQKAPNADFFNGKLFFSQPTVYGANLIASSKEGFHIFDPISNEQSQTFTLKDTTFLSDARVFCGYALPKKRFALGSLKQGALMIDAQGNSLQQYNEGNFLQNNSLYAINGDQSGNLWLGLSTGLSKTEHGQDLGYWDKNAGLKGSVYSFISSQNGLYVSTDQKVYQFYVGLPPQEIGGIPAGFNWVFGEFLPPSVEALHSTPLLLSSTQHGIYQINGTQSIQLFKGGHAKILLQSKQTPNRLYSTDSDYFISLLYQNGKWIPEGKWAGIQDDIRGITEDKDGTLWLGTYSNGIIKITPNFENITQPKSIRYYTEKEGLPSLNNNKPFWYKGQMIWGTEKGLYIHNPKTDRFEAFCGLGKQFCDGSRGVCFFQEMQNGKIYIAPVSNKKQDIGYLKPDGKGGYQWIYKPFRRLPEIAEIGTMYAEENGLLWIGGSEGLFRYKEKEDDKNYEMGFHCWVREVRLAGDSAVFYGGGVFPPPLPPLKRGGVVSGEAARHTEGENSPPSKGRQGGVSGLDPQIFAYKNNSLKFLFAAPFFDNEERTLYSFKLEGFEDGWSLWGRHSEKEYTNLYEGDYVFHVKAKNIYDKESRTDTYAFTVLPPFYRTWWAYSIYMILGSATVFALIKANGRRLENEKIRLEEIVKNRTAEIYQQKEEIQQQADNLKEMNDAVSIKNAELSQQKEEIEAQAEGLMEANHTISGQKEELEAAFGKMQDLESFKEGLTGMIVHDLKNPLNTILGIAEQEAQTPGIAGIRASGQQMLDMVLNILDTQKLENAEMKLQTEKTGLRGIAEKGIAHVHVLLEQKKMTAAAAFASGVWVMAEENALIRIFENLLSNAIKYSPFRSSVEITCTEADRPGMVKIGVKDQGQGIPADKIGIIFDRFAQVEAKKSGEVASTGLGLTFCKLATESMGGKIWAESELGKGTTFFFTLPGGFEEGDNKVPQTNAIPQTPNPIYDNDQIRSLKNLLAGYKIYQGGKVMDALDAFEAAQKPDQETQKWMAELKSAIATYESDYFEELMQKVKSEE